MTETLKAVDDLDSGLAQYGVLGMKWGVSKKERPAKKTDAEKAAETKAKRKKRAQKYVDRATEAKKVIDTSLAERNKKTTGALKRYFLDSKIQQQREIRTRALDDARRKKEGKLSKGEKKLVIGASVVAALIAAKGVQVGLESGEFNRLTQKGMAFMKKQDATNFVKDISLADRNLSPEQIMEKVVKPINPNYGDIGTKMNCRRATFAYELRRRGNNVKATRTTNAFGQHSAGLWNATNPGKPRKRTSMPGYIYEIMKEQKNKTVLDTLQNREGELAQLSKRFPAGAKNFIFGIEEGVSARDAIVKQLSKQPNGSRGELGVMWKGGGGHSIAYEIIDNAAVIFDNQSGQRLDVGLEGKRLLDNVAQAGFTRLDNVELNADYLLRWVNNVTK